MTAELMTSIQGNYSYDQAGNTILANTGGVLTTNSCDCENRPMEASSSAGLSTCSYAGGGDVIQARC